MEKKVSAILDKVRPYIQMHGGDVSLLGVKKGVVRLQVSGACAHCSLADMTYNDLISRLLKEEMPGIRDIVLEK